MFSQFHPPQTLFVKSILTVSFHNFLDIPHANLPRISPIKMCAYLALAAVLVLNTPDDGRLRPKHVE